MAGPPTCPWQWTRTVARAESMTSMSTKAASSVPSPLSTTTSIGSSPAASRVMICAAAWPASASSSRPVTNTIRRSKSFSCSQPGVGVMLLAKLHLAQARVIEERQLHAVGSHPLADLFQEVREDRHLVLGRAAAQSRLARDPIGLDLGGRGAAALDGEPEVPVAAELHVLDH